MIDFIDVLNPKLISYSRIIGFCQVNGIESVGIISSIGKTEVTCLVNDMAYSLV